MNQEDATVDPIDNLIGGMLKIQNQRLSKYGWIRQEQLSTATRYQKSTKHGDLYIDIQKPSEFMEVEPGRVKNFSIWRSVYNLSILGGGNEYFAEIHEASGEPGYVNQRPMKQDELEELMQIFSGELVDFEKVRFPGILNVLTPLKNTEKAARKEIKAVIMEDLDSYYQKALGILPEDWERYELQEK